MRRVAVAAHLKSAQTTAAALMHRETVLGRRVQVAAVEVLRGAVVTAALPAWSSCDTRSHHDLRRVLPCRPCVPIGGRALPSSQPRDSGDALRGYEWLILIAAGVLPALVPIVIAQVRKTTNRTAVVIVALLTTWTLIGWVAAVVMAATGRPETDESEPLA